MTETEKAEIAYREVRKHLRSDDPAELPDDETMKLAEGYAKIIGDEAVEEFSRSTLALRKEEADGEWG